MYPCIPEDMIVMSMYDQMGDQIPYKMPTGLSMGKLFSDMTSFPFVETSARMPLPINSQFVQACYSYAKHDALMFNISVQDNADISGIPSSSLMHRILLSPPKLRIPLAEDRLSDIQSLLTSQELTEENIVLLMQWCKDCRDYAADLLDRLPPSSGLHMTPIHIPVRISFSCDNQLLLYLYLN